MMTDVTEQSVWQSLAEQAGALQGRHLETLFSEGDARVRRLSVEAPGLYLDYSKQRLTPDIMQTLLALAELRRVAEHRQTLFTGGVLNTTEQRAAWHTALRAPRSSIALGHTCDDVHAVLDRMRTFVDQLRSGAWRGFDGRAIRDVVNIGIGGSDLGPRLVCRALADRIAEPRVHFVANVDPADLTDTLAGLNPATTLFVVTSKTFSTAETLANARAARRWLYAVGATDADVARHFVAVSTNRQAVSAFGIEAMFEFWDWVSGRYSLWSAVGLSIALALGMSAFEQLLAGAHAMDRHFLDEPMSRNLPVTLALVGIWNRNFLDLPGHVVVPYAQRLIHFPEWLQQLEMESNGKGVTRDGGPLAANTAPMVWGTVGTNAQHAYFQMLHQASLAADIDFILPLPAAGAHDEREKQRIVNCLAQSEAMLSGRTAVASDSQDEQSSALAAARHFEGDRPSSTLLMGRLDAWHLGALLAAYEHKVFVQGIIWGINSFDQWGVELGKQLAGELASGLRDAETTAHNASTRSLLNRIRRSTS